MIQKISPKKRIYDIVALILLCTGVSYPLFRYILMYPVHMDEGVSLYGAIRILKSQIPYRDFFHFTTPGAAYVLSYVFQVMGPTLFSARCVMLFSILALIVLLFFLGRRLTNSSILGLMSPLMFFFLDSFPNIDYSTHRLAFLFAMLGLAILIGVNKPWGVFFAGICGGVSFHMNQNIGTYSLMGLSLLGTIKPYFLRRHSWPRRGIKYFLVFSLGALPALLLPLVFFAIHGALNGFLYDTIIWPATWYRSFNRYPYFSYELDMTISYACGLYRDKMYVYIFYMGVYLFIGFVPFAIYPAFLTTSFFRREWEAFSLSVLGMFLFLSSSNHPDFLHVLRSFLPLYPLSVFSLLLLWRKIIRGQYLACAPFVSLFLLSVCSLGNGSFVLRKIMTLPAHPVRTDRGMVYFSNRDDAAVMENIIHQVNKTTTPREPVFFYHWSPALYFLCNRDNPTRFDTYKPLYTTPDQLDDLRSQLEKSHPRLIVKDDYIASFSAPKDRVHTTFPFVDPKRLLREDPVDRWILKHYKVTKIFDAYYFLVPTSPLTSTPAHIHPSL